MSSFTCAVLSFTLPALALLACTPTLELADDLQFRETADTSVGCGSCNGNSPRVNDVAIGKLRLDGEENADGLALLGLRPPNSATLYPVTTDANEDLVALSGGSVFARGAALVGWSLVMEQDGAPVVAKIQARSRSVSMLTDVPRTMMTYALSFIPPDDLATEHNVCPGAPGATATVLTVIRGETYDGDLKQVEHIGADWITLACEGEAAYKTKRLGYGPTSPVPGAPPKTVGQRDATIKMVTADYCGTGLSFTEQGETVWWYDAAGTVTVPDVVHVPEAAWTAAGALCLDYPRHADPADVAEECELPSCDDVDLTDADIVWFSDVPPP